MIHLLYGRDDYRSHHALHDIRARLGDADGMLESNTAVLDGRALTPGELLAHASAVPFLAPSRLVIVEGLIAALAQVKGGRRKKPSPDDPLEPWRQAASQLGDPAVMPPSTTLVLMEGDILSDDRGKPKKVPPAAFTVFAAVAQVQEFAEIDKRDLLSWISKRAVEKDVALAPRAVAALSRAVGPDLWALDTELDKLAAYAAGGDVDPDMVAQTVSAVRDTKIWDMTDAIVAGNERKALATMRALLDDGDAAPMLSFMVVRQYRQLVVVKDMRERRARQEDIARSAGIQTFRVDAVAALSSRYSWSTLRSAYRRLLDADLSVKRGECDDETALQLVVHELAAMAPAAPSRPQRSR